jgi:hypothetical protein
MEACRSGEVELTCCGPVCAAAQGQGDEGQVLTMSKLLASLLKTVVPAVSMPACTVPLPRTSSRLAFVR